MYNRRMNKYWGCMQCNMNNNTNNCASGNESDILEDKCEETETLAEMFSNDDNNCECGFDQGMQPFPENPVLAQSYVPIQYLERTFKPCVGLKMGTIFPELVSPYKPCQSIEEIEFIKASNKIGKGCNE